MTHVNLCVIPNIHILPFIISKPSQLICLLVKSAFLFIVHTGNRMEEKGEESKMTKKKNQDLVAMQGDVEVLQTATAVAFPRDGKCNGVKVLLPPLALCVPVPPEFSC